MHPQPLPVNIPLLSLSFKPPNLGLLIIHLKMVNIGWKNLDLAKPVENDEVGSKVAKYDPVDKKSENSVLNSNFEQVVIRVTYSP